MRFVAFYKRLTEQIIVRYNILKEKTQEQYTKLYWAGVTISNNGDVFKEIDKEMVEQLCKKVEFLLVFIDELLKMAEDIQEKIKIVAEELKEMDEKDIKQQINLYTQFNNINIEIDALRILCESYSREQYAVTKDANNAAEVLKERFPKRRWTIIRNRKNKRSSL